MNKQLYIKTSLATLIPGIAMVAVVYGAKWSHEVSAYVWLALVVVLTVINFCARNFWKRW